MIAQLFVPNIGPDGKPFYETDVGAHAVRLHRNGQWEVVVVDDFFPVQIDNPATKGKLPSETSCKGAATGYSEDYHETWVPLLEKAVAKYYGSYAEIEKGFVHQGLQMLTGEFEWSIWRREYAVAHVVARRCTRRCTSSHAVARRCTRRYTRRCT